MKRSTNLFCLIAGMSLAGSVATAEELDRPVVGALLPQAASPLRAPPGESVIWKQEADASNYGLASQDFDRDHDEFDIWVLSNFSTTADWCVFTAVSGATYSLSWSSGEDTTGVTAQIRDGLPWEDGQVVMSSVSGSDNIEIDGTLTADFGGLTLPPGDYYFSIRAARAYGVGQVFLYQSDSGDGTQDWQWNPGGGFGLGEYWGVVGYYGEPQEVNFALYGHAGTCADLAGACCFADPNDCQALTEAVCTAQGGAYLGHEAVCGADCDDSGLGDACDLHFGYADDCNDNGLPDECDIIAGTSGDCNLDGVPDECQLEDNDCNGNGTPDECDVPPIGAGPDCNENVIPDACEADCNNNDIPDECDVAAGTSLDINDNGLPDECECTAGGGDVVYDGMLDLEDAAVLVVCLAGPGVYAAPGCLPVDMDGDCDVDLADWAHFQTVFGNVYPVETTRTELAGNALAQFPFFEYVRAFNEDSGVEIAIDPVRRPEIAGRMCDVYVVAAKTESEWTADPTLIDVRPGGPQTVTFSAASIQANVVTAVEPGELSGDAGPGLGVPYDVVIDCDRDGLLSEVDVIDGLGDEAGLYVVHDLTQTGPLAVVETTYWVPGIPYGPFQRTVYPVDIATMGQLPVVMVTHGAGKLYTWYEYLQHHLASYGCIVVCHQADLLTFPPLSGALSVLYHTDALIENQSWIGGGALDGHVDSHRIIWIGHGWGGESAVLAYDFLFEGSPYYDPEFYTAADIVLVSTIAPSNLRFSVPGDVDPHGVNFHLLYGSADEAPESHACAVQLSAQPFQIFEKATGYRQSTYVHGARHSDFDDSPPAPADYESDRSMAELIGRLEAQRVAKAVYLALVKHYAEGNIPAQDLLWRQWERFRPIGVATTTTVVSEYSLGGAPDRFVIDDYQTEPSSTIASSGGSVTFDVSNVVEGILQDGNASFTWTPDDPMNGMTRAGPYGSTRGVVFEWKPGSGSFYEFEIGVGQQDFSTYQYLSFRACQGTRHPQTVAELGDLTFAVTLRDGGGTTSSINIGAFGGGIEEPYQRTQCGPGIGWQNEFETIRIRLTDYLNNGSGLDLTDIAAVRFEFGGTFGSQHGRIGLDDVEVVAEPARF